MEMPCPGYPVVCVSPVRYPSRSNHTAVPPKILRTNLSACPTGTHTRRDVPGTPLTIPGVLSVVDVFVLSCCRFPFDSCIAFAFTLAAVLSAMLLFCLGATPPPRSLRAWSMRILLACCLLSCVADVDLSLFIFLLFFLPFFDFDCHRLFHSVFFLWVLYWLSLLGLGFCCDSFSVRMIYTGTKYGLLVPWYVSWYVRTLISPFYFCLRYEYLYTICFSCCVYYLLFLFLFVFLLR